LSSSEVHDLLVVTPLSRQNPVEDLKNQGVRFDVCEITLRSRKLKREQFIEEATFVPSGVVEIVRLQQREGHACMRP
jgi:uncharacterized protein